MPNSLFHQHHEMITLSLRSICLEHFASDINESEQFWIILLSKSYKQVVKIYEFRRKSDFSNMLDLFPHPMRVFCTLLEPPKRHIMQKHNFFNFINVHRFPTFSLHIPFKRRPISLSGVGGMEEAAKIRRSRALPSVNGVSDHSCGSAGLHD